MKFKLKKEKGFSLPNVIIGTIISSILVGIGTISVLNVYGKAQSSTIASHLKKQKRILEAHAFESFVTLESKNDPLNGGDANQTDYLLDGIRAGIFEELPLDVFHEPELLTWEIRKLMDGNAEMFYVYISSSSVADQELIEEAVANINISPKNLMVE